LGIEQHDQEVPTMKKKMIIPLITCFVVGLLFNASPTELQAETVFVTIGSGDFTGVYFPTGCPSQR